MIRGGKDFERPDSIEQRDTRISENSHVPWFELACGGMPDGLMQPLLGEALAELRTQPPIRADAHDYGPMH